MLCGARPKLLPVGEVPGPAELGDGPYFKRGVLHPRPATRLPPCLESACGASPQASRGRGGAGAEKRALIRGRQGDNWCRGGGGLSGAWGSRKAAGAFEKEVEIYGSEPLEELAFRRGMLLKNTIKT